MRNLHQRISATKCRVTLNCSYRVTTNLNFYNKLWAGFMLDDFNKMILEVIKHRAETANASPVNPK